MKKNILKKTGPGTEISYCNKCQETKPRGQFYSHKKSRDRLAYNCKVCELAKGREWSRTPKGILFRKHRQATRYGVTVEWYQRTESEQNGCCVICLRPPRLNSLLEVDHNHVTGAVRGLLCHQCNVAVGFLRDDYDNARRAAEYLHTHVRKLEIA